MKVEFQVETSNIQEKLQWIHVLTLKTYFPLQQFEHGILSRTMLPTKVNMITRPQKFTFVVFVFPNVWVIANHIVDLSESQWFKQEVNELMLKSGFLQVFQGQVAHRVSLFHKSGSLAIQALKFFQTKMPFTINLTVAFKPCPKVQSR